jgi:nucleotide-binding universal stress UspA family protein
MQLKKILVPFDFSDHSQKALTWALGLAGKWEAEIRLLHVFQPPMYPPMMAGFLDPSQFEAGLRLEATRRLKEVADREKARRIDTQVTIGEPFVDICRVAKEDGFDLIVMGSHGRTGLAHVLVGSVAERVVRHATCPVLVVSRHAKANS